MCIGSNTVVLIDGKIGDKACLSSLSLVLRHESLPPNTRWHGIPAEPLLEGAAQAAHHAEKEKDKFVIIDPEDKSETESDDEEMVVVVEKADKDSSKKREVAIIA